MSHRPRKRFGQNFLHDPQIIERIVRAINPAPGDRLIEIGPGRGAITAPLLQAAGALDVIELDRDLITPLAQSLGHLGALNIHCRDALTVDLRSLIENGKARLVGNLPYNISTPLLFHLLAQIDCIQDMHFMLQREVVERMAAQPGTPAYGRLSITVGWRCRIQPLFVVGPGAFRPAPKVHSAFVRLVPHQAPEIRPRDPKLFEQLVARAFQQRRKTLRNALRGLASETAIIDAGLDPGARPETLSGRAFAALSDRLHDDL